PLSRAPGRSILSVPAKLFSAKVSASPDSRGGTNEGTAQEVTRPVRMPRTFPAVTRALIQAEKTKRRIERAQFDFVARQSVRAISRYKRLGYSPVVSWRELSTLTHAKLWQNPKFRTVTPGKFRGFVYKA